MVPWDPRLAYQDLHSSTTETLDFRFPLRRKRARLLFCESFSIKEMTLIVHPHSPLQYVQSVEGLLWCGTCQHLKPRIQERAKSIGTMFMSLGLVNRSHRLVYRFNGLEMPNK